MDTKKLDQTYIARTYARHDIELISGIGAELFDAEGKRYIDLGSGIAVNTFGAADGVWADAVAMQARKLQHTSNYYYTAPQAELAKMLCERAGLQAVFFSNSGAEANECAIKAMRKYASDKYGDTRPNIVTLINSFHGRTITTLSATGQDMLHKDFSPFTPGFLHVPANDIAAMEAALNRGDVCGVLLELVQGEGGVIPLNQEYVSAVARMAGQRDVLLALDEVQTGNGRTGELFAFMRFGLAPDIVSTAKGLAGGLPFGATLFNERTRGVLGAGTHGSTFGGNPVCAAAALSTLSRIDDALLAGVNERSAYIRAALENAAGVIGVSGLGLMLGIETVKPAGEILAHCMQRGVLVLTAKTRVRLLPPLNIPMPLLEEGIAVLKEALA